MRSEIQVRLYEELNDLLPPDKRKRRFTSRLHGSPTVRKLLACLGVPEAQVELILIDGISVGFSHRLKTGDFVSVYPVFESLDVTGLVRARKRPLRRTRFMAGPGLIRLVRYLRSLGFDTRAFPSGRRKEVVGMAEQERRILLTKDPSLLESPELSRGYLVRAAKPKDQLLDVLSRFDLYNSAQCSGLQAWLACIVKSRSGSR
jgi:hypothetical protein